MKYIFPLLLLFLFTGCTIKQVVNPVDSLDNKDVCIIENPQVSQQGFLATYNKTLLQKGYNTKILPNTSSITTCKVTSTYTGNWRWDLGLYLAYANIKVYTNGELVGEALYDSLNGGANMSKFIKGEEKIQELVNLLYPAVTPKE